MDRGAWQGPWGRKESDTTEVTEHARTHTHTQFNTSVSDFKTQALLSESEIAKLEPWGPTQPVACVCK